MRERKRMFSGAVQASLAALVLVACSGGDTAMAPRITPDAVRGIVALTGNGVVGSEQFEVCKDFLGGTGPASFTLTGTTNVGGPAIGPHNFQLNDGECLVVYQTVQGETANLTVTETAPSGTGWTTTVSGVNKVNFVDTPFGPTTSNTASGVAASGGNGVLVEFFNEFTPPEEEGCTLTQGYWKTHSEHGPAPEDIRWFDLGDVDGDGTSEGADEAFFNSGKTWYQVFWIAPGQGKNQTPVLGKEYLQLAHQYMAAVLNVAAGATPTTAVTTAINGAEAFFTAGNLTAVPTSSWAGTLGSFNEGTIGPGHCG